MIGKLYFSKNATETSKKNISKIIENNSNIIKSLSEDFIFCLGGDGTFLHAVFSERKNVDNAIFIPIACEATLGFFVEFHENENFHETFKEIVSSCEKSQVKEIPLISIYFDDEKNPYYAVNEIKGMTSINTVTYKIDIDSENLYKNIRSSGFYFSSRYGSTGFNKSYYGPILLTNNYVYKDIVPVNNKALKVLDSHLILGNKAEILLEGNFTDLLFTCDGLQIKKSNVKKIKIVTGEKCVKMLQNKNFNKTHLDKIKGAFL
ncbi:hypothetical protein ASO20_00765 [Mycoplasma sp. (ex Biomphalaria glabrata)]|uniref:hypothetical protein n=1 Tax=Mycoplasma sp. (ex Biomphalaria glabrata) TaxID=1749074 RepID=UPI00073A9056|nr:hypothetical protein [Mycoplasma sp. (ex Biomphalaria glabrata)]ALV23208.1 hypothetical protein ASO20_00765 [Mycoplasma sp. (ex Biomphalaria glabrata)]